MKSRTRCHYCHVLFAARNQFQQACLKLSCQKQRRRCTQKNYRNHNRYDSDYGWDSKKAWREKYGREFMRRYREAHPGYVKENRRKQKWRDGKKKSCKERPEKRIRIGELLRIHVLEESCKERLVRVVSL